jgi:hypothetical protein
MYLKPAAIKWRLIGFEVHTLVVMKSYYFWDVTPNDAAYPRK